MQTPRAFILIRSEPLYRREAFAAGMAACGYEVHGRPRDNPRRDDVLVIWNRYGRDHAMASSFERAGARVIVAENGWLGRGFLGEPFYSLTLAVPTGAGAFPDFGPERWDSFGVEMAPWRVPTGEPDREIVILDQRGIGPPGIAMPKEWSERWLAKLRPGCNVRIRKHPGENKAVELEEDLKNADGVVTWNSAAALKALLLGVPVAYGFFWWLGGKAGTPIEAMPLFRSGLDRMPVFQRLAWGMHRTPELATGEPFARLLALPYFAYGSTHVRK